GCDDLDPIELVTAAEVGTGGLGELDVMIGVAAPDRGGVAVGFESFLGVLADALEQPVAHPTAAVVVGDDQGLGAELPQGAGGLPSGIRNSTPTALALRSVSANSFLAARARSENSRTASAPISASTSLSSAGTPSDETATIRSPASASPSRLVARTDTRAHRWVIF